MVTFEINMDTIDWIMNNVNYISCTPHEEILHI